MLYSPYYCVLHRPVLGSEEENFTAQLAVPLSYRNVYPRKRLAIEFMLNACEAHTTSVTCPHLSNTRNYRYRKRLEMEFMLKLQEEELARADGSA